MATITSRKTFIGRVTVSPDTATSLYSLMRDSPLHWGYESTALTTPSMDSIIGSECEITPEGGMTIGSDSNVRTQGIPVAGGATFSLQDFGPGLIDPNQIYVYAQSGGGMAVTFKAR